MLAGVTTARSISIGRTSRRRLPGPRMALTRRVLLLNSAVMLVACLVLALGPATVSTPVRDRELLVLLVGVAATIAVNVLLVRRTFAPLQRLTALMHTVDPLAPGTRLRAGDAPREVRELADAFNDMLERLERERRESARRALRAQEAERRRLARELHDELGQSLTGVLLGIDEAIRAPETADLAAARECARSSLDDVRRIARALRPDTLVELGLPSALNALATRFTRQTGVAVEREIDRDLPALGDDANLVLYRVAQEALTNIARHAHADHVTVALARTERSIVLTVDDDGRGIAPYLGSEARGITGMRERALLVHGRLTIGRSPRGGTRVRLEIDAS